MSSWDEQFWESSIDSGLPRRERRSGAYSSYVPDPLMGRHFPPSAELDAALTRAERAIRRINDPALQRDLAGLSRFLLRSEAIASSQIEGVSPNARNVALAELAAEHDEDIRGLSDQAHLVARNMTAVRAASEDLASREIITTADIVRLHAALIDDPAHQGIRIIQNWIGGSSFHPLDAEFVPPAPEHAPGLMDDLAAYLSGATHSPILQAALVHAQFETIHPFADGNGRVGRALIHTVFTRRGLTPTSMLPISLILATFRNEYVEALSAYRYTGASDSPEAREGQQHWISFFCECIERACEQSRALHQDIQDLREEWDQQIADQRAATGSRFPRADSATAQILAGLPSAPVLTAKSAAAIFNTSEVSASRALSELHEAGIVSAQKSGREQTFYSAQAILDLVTITERRLASTRFDTQLSPPNRPVAARPH